MPIKSIQLNPLPLRLLMLAAIVFVLFFVYLTLKWSFGSMFAKQSEVKEVVELATEMSPNDPQGYYSLGLTHEKSFLPEDFVKALEYYEKAVRVSPYDFRLWLALGKARERNGDAAGAEKALRRALELAPNYAELHWTLGNFLLRQGVEDEAFTEMRRAIEQDAKYANPAVAVIWQLFEGNVDLISQKIGNSLPIKASLAPFLAKQKRFDEAFAFWNSIPEAEKATTYRKVSEDLRGQLFEAKSFRNALNVHNQIARPDEEKYTIGSIFNGDFEKEIKAAKADMFDWRLGDGIQPGISPDSTQKHGGSRSLTFIFNSDMGKDLRTIQQTVVVESQKAYKLEGFYRSELRTLGNVRLEVLDAADNNVLAAVETSPNAKEWAALTLDFTTPAATQAVIIRLGNMICKQALCPISGKFWFDDLVIRGL
jgi:tetratricopeptide (TPR) repeat protein